MELLIAVAASVKLDKNNLIPEGMKIQAFSIHDQYTDNYLGAGSRTPVSPATALKDIKKLAVKYNGVNVLLDLLDTDGRLIRSKRSYKISHGDLVQPYPGSDSVLQDVKTPTPKPTNQAKKVRYI